jgi:hypothetical protein
LLVVPLSSVLKFLNAIVWFLYIPNGQVSLRTAARANKNELLFSVRRRRRRERRGIALTRIRSGKEVVDREVIF